MLPPVPLVDYQVGEEGQKKEALTGSKRHTTVEKVYSYEPTPLELSAEEGKYILGAQGNVWTEYMPTWDLVEYNVLPRMTALSEVVWSTKKNRDWEEMKGRAVVDYIAEDDETSNKVELEDGNTI